MVRCIAICWLAVCTCGGNTAAAAVGEWYVIEPTAALMVLADTSMDAAGRGLPVSVSACAGEYESASFVLVGGAQDRKGLRLSASDLHSANGGTLSREDIDVRFVKRWYQADGAWTYFKRVSGRRLLVPELLVKDWDLIRLDSATKDNYLKVATAAGPKYLKISDDAQQHARPRIIPTAALPVQDADELSVFDLPAHENQQIWLTFHVPEGARPGLYQGVLNVSSPDAGELAVPLSLEILPFALAQSGIEYSIYYRAVLTADGSISSEDKSERQMRAELADLVRHGIRNPTVYQPPHDMQALRRVLTLRREAGITSKALYYLGIRTEDTTAAAAGAYARSLAGVRGVAAEFGIRDVYVYGIDEAAPEVIQRQRPAWSAIHTAGGKVFAAGWTPGHFASIGDVVDLFVSGTVPSLAELAQFHSLGKRVFLYNQPQAGIENPAVYRLNYGVRLWGAGYDGAMIYAYQHGFGSVWNDFDDAEYRDHNFTYPTANGVIDTLAWEGFREGIDDVRYLQTLADEIAKKSASSASPAIREAQQFLDMARAYRGDSPAGLRARTVQHILRVGAES